MKEHTRTIRGKIELTRSDRRSAEQHTIFKRQQPPELKKAASPRTGEASWSNLVEQPHEPADASTSICTLNEHRPRAAPPPPSPPRAGDDHDSSAQLPPHPPRPTTRKKIRLQTPRRIKQKHQLRRSGDCRTPKARASAATTAASSGKSTPRLRRAAAAPATADLSWAPAGAPETEEGAAAARSLSGRAALTTAPPAGHPRTPRLYTRRDPSIPRPPAAGAAAEGEKSAGSPPASWSARDRPKYSGRKRFSRIAMIVLSQ